MSNMGNIGRVVGKEGNKVHTLEFDLLSLPPSACA